MINIAKGIPIAMPKVSEAFSLDLDLSEPSSEGFWSGSSEPSPIEIFNPICKI